MNDFFFNGIWRMDWGFGNPNKTAIMIAELMICVWGLVYIKKYGFILATVIFLFLGGCLFHTFSRGGLVAVIVGCSILLITYWKKISQERKIAILMAVIILFIYALYLGLHKRCMVEVIVNDRSVTNRIEIWKSVPYMIVDAPSGWGWGNSGAAFMRWYQSPERVEPYRTLVNSHFTWLVEGSWIFRFSYISFWLFILLLCFPMKQKSLWLSFPFAIWICFGIGAFFSSVAESIILWILPIFSFGAVLYLRFSLRIYSLLLCIALSISLSICLLVHIIFYNKSGIGLHNENLILGMTEPQIWIIINEEKLGEYEYARSLRKFFAEFPMEKRTIIFTKSINDVPYKMSSCKVLLIASIESRSELSKLGLFQNYFKKIYLLSPQFTPEDLQSYGLNLKKIKVFFGEYSQSPYLFTWHGLQMLTIKKGTGDFFQDIPAILFKCNTP